MDAVMDGQEGRGDERLRGRARAGLRVALGAALLNAILAGVKFAAGLAGQSTALLADGVESVADVFSSLVVGGGLRIAARPPDRSHPYGHGKAESVAALFAAFVLFVAAASVAVQGVRELMSPSGVPSPFTLWVLVGVIVVKEGMYQWMRRVGRRLESRSLEGDAWHHRSDVLTSLTALIGVGLACTGDGGLAWADDVAALVACGIILTNAVRLVRPAVDEVMDASVAGRIEGEVRGIAKGIAGVCVVNRCRIRKSGLGYQMDLHISVDGEISVRAGHAIGHEVEDALFASQLPISDVVVHVEPNGGENSAAASPVASEVVE